MADFDDGYEKVVVLPTDTDSERMSVEFDSVRKHHPNGAARVHGCEEACWDTLSNGAVTEDPGKASDEMKDPLRVPKKKRLQCVDGNNLRKDSVMNEEHA